MPNHFTELTWLRIMLRMVVVEEKSHPKPLKHCVMQPCQEERHAVLLGRMPAHSGASFMAASSTAVAPSVGASLISASTFASFAQLLKLPTCPSGKPCDDVFLNFIATAASPQNVCKSRFA